MKEQRQICLSVSRKNQDAKDIVESWAMNWNMDLAPAFWRIVREYDMMKRWTYYTRE